jgi:hypothetical protein
VCPRQEPEQTCDGPPLGHRYQAGFNQFEAVEEPCQPVGAAVDPRVLPAGVPRLDHAGHLLRVVHLGVVAQHQVAARTDLGQQPTADPVRLLGLVLIDLQPNVRRVLELTGILPYVTGED